MAKLRHQRPGHREADPPGPWGVVRSATVLALTAISSTIACTGPSAWPPAEPDPLLTEAIDWYTGVAGSVDDQRARELLEQAAADKDPLSMMWMARVHSTGRMGFARDTARARTLARGVIDEVERAADAGVLEAVFLMGTAYDEGLGKEPDAASAFQWHLRAAEEGHVLGQHNVGNQYQQGRGVDQDPAAAVHWWRLAAERGDAITQLRLGEAYERGFGIPQDLEAATRWYASAANAGNRQAADSLVRLANREPGPA